MYENYMKMNMPCTENNNAVVVQAVVNFAEQLNPTINELEEVSTAVIEALNNIREYAYPECVGEMQISCKILKNNVLGIVIKDKGVGVGDVTQIIEPLFSTKPNEHSGMGISVMEAFMTECKISSELGKGTIVNMKKRINKH